MEYETFMTDEGKTVVAVDDGWGKEMALTIANEYFHARVSDLEIQNGNITGDTLEIGVKGDFFVVSRRAKA